MSEPRDGTDIGFPLSAIVGQDQLRLALILCAVHPGIGGVLVRGEKGTAKSTAVRALAQLLPPVLDDPADGAVARAPRPARLVELPVGATEDRVVGSLDLEKVLRDGERAFQPGLLAAAHQGVLYVDEVNLLHDHLVDVLLDAAAMGRVHIERDGVSYSHPAKFVLVGTMNPEEGELRPQLLDRFGLAVDVMASREVDTRVEVIRRRLAYEADPVAFARDYADADAELARRIVRARAHCAAVDLPGRELRRIAALCAAFDVDGMRADLVVARAATAHAAWRGVREVTEQDVRVAAEMALPHRRRRDPFDEPGLDADDLDQAMEEAAREADREPEPDPDPEPGPGGGGADESGEQSAGDGPADQTGDGPDADEPAAAPQTAPTGAQAPEQQAPERSTSEPSAPDAPTPGEGTGAGKGPGRTIELPGRPFRTRLLQIPGIGEGAPGRRSRARSTRGRSVRPTLEPGHGLHLVGTLFAAAEHQVARGRHGGRMMLAPKDLRGAVREGREGNLVVFLVDASGSMAARDRLTAVAGAVVSLLRDAYQRRDKVAVISMRGADAEVLLPPTSSVEIAVRRLATMRTGGRTPLAQGFLKAREMVLRERVRDPRRRALVVTLTDGRATGGPDPVVRARTAATLLAESGAASVVIDCEVSMIRLGLAAEMARALRGECLQLAELSAQQVADVVRAAA
ncbi:magnesium chelatase subunit D family protein [Rhodococcus sp. D2-41]|uniref:magnesium chelatase subunit D family protein n=1 Tax=Speluncibacter jeojiensis TaxID=2710754 RepID=UPI00240F9863|nr:magnesium chelatase subunit D family protein [Rhodococcus sp. D2-41]MDG3010963.1 magnesium chelatase subunit D family protein [Rhodococcus sp. D2-41]